MAVRLRLALFLAAFTFNAYHGVLSTWLMPSTEPMFRTARILLDGIYIGVALLVLWRNRSSLGATVFVLFLFAGALSLIYTSGRYTFSEQMNGARESIYFFSTLVLVYDLYHSSIRETFVRLFTLFLVTYAILQIPTATVQFLKWGAGDYVGGTFGVKGGSGYMSQILFLICFYLIVRNASTEEGDSFRIGKIVPFFLLLIPCLINETKVSFVLLAVMVLLLVKSGRRVSRMLPLLLVGLGVMYLLVYYYTVTVEDPLITFNADMLDKYLYSNKAAAGEDLPRFQRVVILLQMMKDDLGSLLLGMGYGAVGGGSYTAASRFSRSIYYLVLGSRILIFRVWIQGGLIAVLIFAVAMFGWMRAKAGQYHTLRQFKWFLAFSLLVVWLYNEAMIDRVFAPVACFLMIWIQNGGIRGESSKSDEASSEPPDEQA